MLTPHPGQVERASATRQKFQTSLFIWETQAFVLIVENNKKNKCIFFTHKTVLWGELKRPWALLSRAKAPSSQCDQLINLGGTARVTSRAGPCRSRDQGERRPAQREAEGLGDTDIFHFDTGISTKFRNPDT